MVSMENRNRHDAGEHPAATASGEPGDAGEPGGAGEGQLEAAILALLAARAETSSICPSDAARAVAPEDWRPLMEPVRRAAARLADRGEVEITQHGNVVDLAAARGPIRIRRPR